MVLVSPEEKINKYTLNLDLKKNQILTTYLLLEISFLFKQEASCSYNVPV
jgi:hypothetical protein